MDSEEYLEMMPMGPMMHMSFYNTNELILVFKGLDSSKESGKYAGLLCVLIMWVVLGETLNYYRWKVN